MGNLNFELFSLSPFGVKSHTPKVDSLYICNIENDEEESFGRIEEVLETHRSIPFPRAVLESLRDARHYKFDEVITIL